MAMYFNMKAENGETVINQARWLIGDIWETILKETNQLNENDECMEFCKDYYIDIQHIPRIIDYYENLIEGKYDDGFGMYSLIRHRIIPSLKRQVEYQVSEHRKYIIRWD